VFEKLDRILAICLDPEAYIPIQKASSSTDAGTSSNFNLGLETQNLVFISQRSLMFNQKISKADEELAKAKSMTR